MVRKGKWDPEKPGHSPTRIYPTAAPVRGRPGFAFNPFTKKAVDLRGIPGGTLVRDPNDGNPDHKFYTPPANLAQDDENN